MSTLIQRSFAGGELAPALYARVDTVKYATGLRTCRNSYVMRHGGATSRPGTTFVAEVKDSSKFTRLIEFIFNADQTYVLEFGDQYMRVFHQGAAVIPAIWSSLTSYLVGDIIRLSGINYICTLDNINQPPPDVTYWDVYSGTAYEIVTPYVTDDLADIQFIQSADVITLVHPNYAPRELARTGNAAWRLTPIVFGPTIAAPTGLSQSAGTGSITSWVVTAISEATSEESLASASADADRAPDTDSPIDLSWNPVAGAQSYNVYKSVYGYYGYLGTVTGTAFTDQGLILPDYSSSPPLERTLFNSTGNYPSAVTYFQQRLTFANTNNEPETVWMSQSGNFKNFNKTYPIQADNAVTFTMAGRQVNSVRHLIELGSPVVLTSGAEWVLGGDSAGIIAPGEINAKQQTYNGSSTLPPLLIGGNALYVQARASIVRDLGFDFQVDGYRGNDLTIFSAHLVDGYTLSGWAYQQIPHSVVWAIRNDGVLLGLTYVREHQIAGWSRHDTDGTFESLCAVPEGTEDSIYVIIKRVINGSTKRYVERLNTRAVTADTIQDFIGMDCALSYDGRNISAKTMTLSGGTDWTYTETLTLTCSEGFFISGDVGNAIFLTGSDGTLIRFTIGHYTSSTVVTGSAHKTVPVAMRSAAMLTWSRAVDEVGGLSHLEGKVVSIMGDGFVVASPNNAAYVTRTVSSGIVTLDKPYAVIHVGLPYFSDIETLDIDTTQSETITDKKKIVQKVTLHVESSRGAWVGPKPPTDDDADPLENLYEMKLRDGEGYDEPVLLKTGTIDVNIKPEWNSNGRVFIRQVDPLPLSILAVAGAGMFPFRTGGG